MKKIICEELVKRDSAVIAQANHLSYFPLVVKSVKGAIITDEDGFEYVDFLSSASSLNLGSCHPRITKALQEQLEMYTQYTNAYTYGRNAIEYAEELVSLYPGGLPAKVCYGNCGSDANDAAVKYARGYTGRSKVIVFQYGYHGNTYMASSMTTVTTRMREKIGPMVPDIYVFPFCGKDEEAEAALAPMLEAFKTHLPPSEVACMVIEPIQGDSGIIPASKVFMKRLYEICKQHGILFIAEEVQQAFGRTGKWFSIEHYDIVPDGIVLGKSVGGGLTLGAFMGKAEIMDCLPAPAHLFTLGGNAIACKAGCEMVREMKETDLFAQVDKKGADIMAFFKELGEQYGIVGEVRGLGLSIGVEIIDKESGKADSVATSKICFRSYEKGLVMISLAGNVLRVQPPLVITEENIEVAKRILREVFQELAEGKIPDSVLEYAKGW